MSAADLTMTDPRFSGIGMTSLRTRDRLVQRLREQGIANLDGARSHPQPAAPHLRRRGAGEPRLRGHGAADRLRPDDLAALHRRAHDRGAARGPTAASACSRWAPAAATRPPCSRRWSNASTPSSASTDCRSARASRLKELGVRNVRFKVGDGSLGWRSQAPFDGILVAAAPLRRAGRADRAARARAVGWSCRPGPKAASNCCASCAAKRASNRRCWARFPSFRWSAA